MTLYHAVSRAIVCEKTRLARSSAERAKGLMFASSETTDYALIFELPRAGRLEAAIHMFFVFFEIDAVFLDEQKKVVDVARRLKPFSLGYVPRQNARFIIEWPAGHCRVDIGDTLAWD